MKERLKCQAAILKVASRCNLNCDYCYMYNLADKSYLGQPKFMSGKIVEALINEVKNHCLLHGIKHFEFIFHGGEPLLLSPDFYIDFVETAGKVLDSVVTPGFSLQTNGVLLTDKWCEVFASLGIRVGISLDGLPAIHDAHRVDHQGRGSYQATLKGLKIAQESAYLKGVPGVLTVIDVDSDPVETYHHLKSLGIRHVNFLFPDGNFDYLPKGIDFSGEKTLYADWLISLFDTWLNDTSPKPEIRLFRQVMQLVLGIDNGFEYWGKRRNEFIVIETDGSIEAIGALKSCGENFTKAGVNILSASLDEALQTDLAQIYHLSHEKLCSQCLNCPVGEVCGGGYLPHRFGRNRGFNNPSVYCQDLLKLICHIQHSVLDDLPEELLESIQLEKIDYLELRNDLHQSGTTDENPVLESFGIKK